MLILFIIVLLDLIGFGFVIPLLPYYAKHFGASDFSAIVLMGTYSGAQLLMAPVLGRLSDRFGRRPILLLSLMGSVLSYLWLGLADALWVLFASRALQGAMAGNIATAQAYIADVTTPENRAKGMGMIGAAFGLGFIIGPFFGGWLAGSDPLHPNSAAPAFGAAALSALALIAAAFFLKESLPAEMRWAARSCVFWFSCFSRSPAHFPPWKSLLRSGRRRNSFGGPGTSQRFSPISAQWRPSFREG
jgi:MFS transporter, DHA1 family, tetracycline resistance protein